MSELPKPKITVFTMRGHWFYRISWPEGGAYDSYEINPRGGCFTKEAARIKADVHVCRFGDGSEKEKR